MIVPSPRPAPARFRPHATLALLAALVASLPAQEPGDRLLVCNRSEDTLSIFDPRTGRELATLKTGPTPAEVAVSADGRTAVVSNARSGGGAQTADLTVVDVVAARVRGEVRLAGRRGHAPSLHGVAFAPDGRAIAVSGADGRAIAGSARASAWSTSWSTGQRAPQLVAVTPDGQHAVTTSPRDGTVSFVPLAPIASGAAPRVTRTGVGAEGIALHPVTGEAWVASRDDDLLSVVSAASGEVLHTFDTGRAPLRVAFTPRGDRVLVTCVRGGELMIFDAAARALLGEVSIHGDRSEQSSLPRGVVSDPAGERAYVTCARGEFIAVIDLRRAEVVARIDARRGPAGLAFARPRR